MTAHNIKPEALPAWYALGVLLDRLAEEGRPTFCQRDPEPFTSEDNDERREAAEACAACPAVVECRRFADENDEPAHVWGGVDRTRRPYSRKKGNHDTGVTPSRHGAGERREKGSGGEQHLVTTSLTHPLPASRHQGGGLATESAADCDPPRHKTIPPQQIVGGSDVA